MGAPSLPFDEIRFGAGADVSGDCPHHDACPASKNHWLWGVLGELERQQFSGAVEIDFRKGKALMFAKSEE